MSEKSKIEWCDSTFNPWIGCTAISPACDNCYAADWAKRYGRDFAVRTRTKTWGAPLKWEREHAEFFAEHGRRRRVFCASLADVFDNEVPAAWRADLFALIEATPNLDWLLLTKRIGNVETMWRHCWVIPNSPPRNMWIGATICNQAEADRDIPKLLRVPAAVRFVSIEPMLGPIDLTGIRRRESTGRGDPDNYDHWTYIDNALTGFRAHKCGGITDPRYALDWVIAGGESGHHARPSHPDWFRSLRDQCAAAGVPFLFKQWGEWAPNWLNDDAGNKILGSEWADKMGKKIAGRMLDGAEHNEFPETRA